MSAVELFTFPETGQQIRTVMVDGTPCLVAAGENWQDKEIDAALAPQT